MFKNKIALKLSSYFAIALLVFSIIIGSIFMILFRNHTVNIHKKDLSSRANLIATTLSEFMDSGNNKKGYGAYTKFIGDIAGSDVWIVDENLNLITGGKGKNMSSDKYTYSQLPQNADILIKEVFNDKTVFSEDFSNILSELTLTIGTPIKDSNNNVIGVVLLHSPITGIDSAVYQGLTLLIVSILVAPSIAFLLSIWFSISFTKPLSIMNTTANELIEGNYNVKNNISQNDEIGDLANTMDILTIRLDTASKQSEKLDKMRTDFVANISHELKTPITVIRGSLEALVDKIVTDPIKVHNYHNQMLSETLFLQRLVGDLLDLSKLQNTDFAIEKHEISILDVVDDAIRSASHISFNKNISINLCKPNNPVIINGDYGRLRQMFMIILNNAIKFSPENSIIDVIFDNNTIS
ncbi:MAG: histidine kinase dimerization/phospho-acceptor domain-containing protein, partial [Clostridium sp.]